MRKLTAFLAVAILGVATWAHAGAAAVGSLTFHPDTGQVAVTTDCTKGTQFLTQTSFVSHNIVVNPSTWTVLYVSTSSSNLSPSGSFFIPINSSLSPDGPADAYDGPMWGCSSSTVANTQAFGLPKMSVLRVR